MSTPIQIKDGKGTKKTAHLHQEGKDIGIVAFTDPLKERKFKILPALNATYGAEIAVDAGFGGTPDVVHTGITDGVNWTGSNEVGAKGNFDSKDQANSGTVSVKWDNPAVDDVIQFDKGSNLTISSYTAVTMFVYVDKDWSAGESMGLFAWDVSGAVIVGNEVLLEDYINEFDFDTWQKASIPFGDLGLSSGTFDALRIQMQGVGAGKNPKVYFDDIQMEQTGTPVEYTIAPSLGEIYLVDRLQWTFVDALDTTLADASMPSLSYDKILGVTLSNGIVLQWIQDAVVQFSSTFTSLGDGMKGGVDINNMICDGTNTAINVSLNFPEPVRLDPRTFDEISIVISDDLSGWITASLIAIGRTEAIDQ